MFFQFLTIQKTNTPLGDTFVKVLYIVVDYRRLLIRDCNGMENCIIPWQCLLNTQCIGVRQRQLVLPDMFEVSELADMRDDKSGRGSYRIRVDFRCSQITDEGIDALRAGQYHIFFL